MRFLVASAALCAAACLTACESDAGVAGPPPLAQARLHRITELQYRNQLADVLGVPDSLTLQLPHDTSANGFTSIGAGQNGISSLETDLYAAAAYRVADAVANDPVRLAALVSCSDGDDACVRSAEDDLLRRLFRRPMTESQRVRYHALEVTTGGHVVVDATVRALVSAALQSPSFLYRVEHGIPASQEPDGDRTLDAYEQAARLSAFFWNASPDDELLAAARAGDPIADAQIERLAASPRFEAGLVRFLSELFALDQVWNVSKGALLPSVSDADRAAIHHETESLFQTVAHGGDVRTLFTTRASYVDDALAPYYGLDATQRGEIQLAPELGRGGVLGRAAFLMVNAHAQSTSPTLRGKFVRTRLLCETIPAPPPGAVIDLTIHEGDPPSTLRSRLERIHAQGTCATCHRRLDPIGFALEDFDAIGYHRDTDEGLPIDSTADLDGVPIHGAAELGAALAQHASLAPCLTRQMFRHAMGRIEYADEEPELAALAAALASSGYELPALARAIVRSDSFRRVRMVDTGAAP